MLRISPVSTDPSAKTQHGDACYNSHNMARSKKTEGVQEYVITLDLAGQKTVSSGSSVLEAFEKLEAPAKIMNKGTIKVQYGNLSKQLFMMPAQMRRFLWPVARHINAKMLSTGMK